MGKRRHTPEQIINKLREAEVELGRGMKVPEVCKKLGIADYTYYRWRKECGVLHIAYSFGGPVVSTRVG